MTSKKKPKKICSHSPIIVDGKIDCMKCDKVIGKIVWNEEKKE
jgi:hypothetical protein